MLQYLVCVCVYKSVCECAHVGHTCEHQRITCMTLSPHHVCSRDETKVSRHGSKFSCPLSLLMNIFVCILYFQIIDSTSVLYYVFRFFCNQTSLS